MNLDVHQLIAAGESETVEIKGPRASLDVLSRSICGLLNQRGGVVLWGVTDDQKIVVFLTLKDAPRT